MTCRKKIIKGSRRVISLGTTITRIERGKLLIYCVVWYGYFKEVKKHWLYRESKGHFLVGLSDVNNREKKKKGC